MWHSILIYVLFLFSSALDFNLLRVISLNIFPVFILADGFIGQLLLIISPDWLLSISQRKMASIIKVIKSLNNIFNNLCTLTYALNRTKVYFLRNYLLRCDFNSYLFLFQFSKIIQRPAVRSLSTSSKLQSAPQNGPGGMCFGKTIILNSVLIT